MRQKFLAVGAIALMAVVGLFIFEQFTSAQRPDRNAEPGQQQRGGNRGGMDMMRMFNPMSIADNSWLDLTFKVNVDDETLVKARPIYAATREKFEKKMAEVRESQDMRAAMTEMQTFIGTVGKEFQAELKKVLSAEELTKLNELTKERQIQEQERRNRFRGGQRGGQGGQRGQRPTE